MNTIEITPEDFRLIKSFHSTFQRTKLANNKYVISWNELMPVVEKIQEIEGISFALTPGLCTVQDFRHKTKPRVFSGEGTNIQAVYEAVVNFIKWHNSNHPNQ